MRPEERPCLHGRQGVDRAPVKDVVFQDASAARLGASPSSGFEADLQRSSPMI